MAVMAFMFGSVIGSVVALFLWLAVGFSLAAALAVYLGIALGVGACLILASIMQPPGPMMRATFSPA